MKFEIESKFLVKLTVLKFMSSPFLHQYRLPPPLNLIILKEGKHFSSPAFFFCFGMLRNRLSSVVLSWAAVFQFLTFIVLKSVWTPSILWQKEPQFWHLRNATAKLVQIDQRRRSSQVTQTAIFIEDLLL